VLFRSCSADGVSLLNTNGGILGTTGTVGVGADGVAATGDESTLAGVQAPELQLVDKNNIGYGLNVLASNIEIAFVSVKGFETANINVDGSLHSVTGFYLHDSVIGSRADSFASASSQPNQGDNILIAQADSGRIQDNLIGFAARTGIRLMGAADFSDSVENWTISGNEIRSNGQVDASRSGIDLLFGTNNIVVASNLIVNNSGFGVDTLTSSGATIIANNTIRGNGAGGLGSAGIRLSGNSNVVQNNSISNNDGAGIHVVGQSNNSDGFFAASSGNLVSKNSFANNNGNAIDLSSDNTSTTTMNAGDGITLNDGLTNVADANLGLDYPVIANAVFEGNQTGINKTPRVPSKGR